ncbi:MAG: D-aminoacyl-tRNA deacylase [Verrucomicrobia bacterium]|nr:D-aminoacyl-tRNA deacylase [Verrucomicrobiota bacterium]
MKVLIQRVSQGCVRIDGAEVGRVGRGFVVLVGVRAGDDEAAARQLAQKTVALRIFADTADKMNLSLQDIGGGVLVISQFTLYADTRKGNRPSFIRAGPPDLARHLYDTYVDALRSALGPTRVATGQFAASMQVELVNDGPVTIELNTDSE